MRPPLMVQMSVAVEAAVCCQTVYVGLLVTVATIWVMTVMRRAVFVGVGRVMETTGKVVVPWRTVVTLVIVVTLVMTDVRETVDVAAVMVDVMVV